MNNQEKNNTSFENVKKEELTFVRSRGNYANLKESDGSINDIQREKIKAFKETFGQCFLGKINYYGEERENLDNQEILIEYDGQLVYNFQYDFCVTTKDEILIELIKEWNKKTVKISPIYNRIEKINGEILTWV